MKTLVPAGLSLVLMLFQSVALAQEVPILRFGAVAPGIFRGARPETVGMQALKSMNIRTDIDLEDDQTAISQEASDANRLKIRFVSMPMSGFWAPSDQTVATVLGLLADPSNYPVYVHCQHGEDRTGLIVGLYRVFYQHWAPAVAYDEMLRLGFHRSLLPLNHYFETKTGFED